MKSHESSRDTLYRCVRVLAFAAIATPIVLWQASAITSAGHGSGICIAPSDAPATSLTLKPDDHIAILGNVLADRMQFDGWLETLIQRQFAGQYLVVRNLAAAGDEVSTWHRSQDFGTRDQWLAKTGASVIFAFYGYNETFAGAEGLPKFKADLDKFLKDMASGNFNAKGAPRVVLFSPVADEKTQDPNFPDPTAVNANLALYATAMADVAKANHVQFIDLLGPSADLYAKAAAKHQSLTVNGHYLTDEANRLLAPIMFRAIFNQTPPTSDPALDLEKLRAAINEKNAQWHARYRTIDGFNVYGGRSHMAYASGKGGPKITNNEVMQQEMSQRDILTANRDKRVWAIAMGKDAAVDDSNLPPVQQIKTNDPGPNPDGSWIWPGAEDAIKQMKVAEHTRVNLFASEEQFPELVNPLQMAWDTKGRLWVTCWKNYPERTPTSKTGDCVLILEDTRHTGHADKVTHFIDDLNAPTGFQFYKDGILLMQAPDLWYVKDTAGGDHANSMERVLMGIDSADSHHTCNSMVYDPGGAVYLSDGVFHRTQVETASGPQRNQDACIWRFVPRTGQFERYAAYGFANPHGRVFDYWGNDIITDATGNNSYFGPAISGHIDYPAKHTRIDQFWVRPSRPCPGTGLMTSHHFPDEFWGNFLNCNVIGFQGIYRVKMVEEGSGIKGISLEDLVSSPDRTFRPSQVNTGPDGAIYFADWSQSEIGHLQHHLRDPNRSQTHGRIYRMTYEGRSLETPPRIDGQPIPALLELLKRPENQVRTLAKIELDKHPTADVIAGVKAWMATLNTSDATHEHDLMEALWVHQWQNVADIDLLKRMLRSPEPRARAAATRVLCYWRNRVPEAVALLKVQAGDENPRVRLEAIRACSFFTNADAAEAALAALKYPTDYYIDYTLKETMKQLEKYWKTAVAAGKPFAADNPAGREYVGHAVNIEELLKLPHTEAVLQAILLRPDAGDAVRTSTLNELAEIKKTKTLAVVLQLLEASRHSAASQSVLAKLLPMQPAPDLKASREQLVALASQNESADVRQAAWAAVATADESLDKAWAVTVNSPKTLIDVLSAIPLIFDQDIRGKAYDNVKPLIGIELPPEYAAMEKNAPKHEVSRSANNSAPAGSAAIATGDDAAGMLRAAAIKAAVSMTRDQKMTFAALVALIEKQIEVVPASRGIRTLPRKVWDRTQAGPLAAALVSWAKTIPTDARTSPDYAETIQFAGDLAGMLPPADAASMRKELKELRVSVFVIRTVREQMRYDTPRLVVEAGKPLEIILENGDFMPHNLAVITPGSRARLAEMSAVMKPDDLDSRGRAFIPKSPDILAASKLVEPGQQDVIKLRAPKKEGDYEYFCTYPGHWEIMWGTLVVTKDVDAYLQAHPDTAGPAGNAMGHGRHHMN